MATAERILHIERGIVCSMEKEIRQMLVKKQQEKELSQHRDAMEQKCRYQEQRKRADNEQLMEEHAAKAAKQRERREIVLDKKQEEKDIKAAIEKARKERALDKKERIDAEREAELEQHRFEAEARREAAVRAKEQQIWLKEKKANEVWNRLQAHEEACQQIMLNKALESRKIGEHHEWMDRKSKEKREEFKAYQEEMKQITTERLRQKHERAEALTNKKQADIQSLAKIKEDFEAKKREMRNILDEASKTGDLQLINSELEKLKAHQAEMEMKAHQEWAEKSFRSLSQSPRRLQAKSVTTPSSTASTAFPPNGSPLMPGFIKQRGGPSPRPRPNSAPRSQPLSSRSAYFLEPMQSPGSTFQEVRLEPEPDSPAPGSHYAHLMGLFKARVTPVKTKFGKVPGQVLV